MVNLRYVAGGLLAIVLLAVGVGAVFFYGVGPAPGGPESGTELTDIPTATPADGAMSEGAAETTATETAPFTFTIDEIEECGQTCRDVTATLHNNQEETATGVSVFTRVFAGEDNTDEEDLVWEGKEEIGTVEAGGSHSSTERVELSLQEALKIDQHDGWITIVTTVQSDDTAVTFRDSERVD